MDLWQQFQRNMKERELCKPGDTILLGLSGGADSTALFYLLFRYAKENNCRLLAAHLNHGLRPEAICDQKFSEELCLAHQVPFFVEEQAVQILAQRNKKGEEEQGRICRQAFFERLAQRYQVDVIALGHHGDDQAETMMLNLLRGTSLRGLGAMRFRRERYIRPLLDVPKEHIVSYLNEADLAYVTDESNVDKRYRRNLIRHELLPAMEKINPQITKHLMQLSFLLQSDADALDQTYADWALKHIRRVGRLGLDVSAELLFSLPKALRWRFYQDAYSYLCSRPLEKKYLADLDYGLQQEGVFSLPGAIQMKKRRGRLLVGSKRVSQSPYEHTLTLPGSMSLDCGLTVSVEPMDRGAFQQIPKNLRGNEQKLYADAERVGHLLRISSPSKGMKYRPWGSAYPIKVRQHFSSLGYGPLANARLPVISTSPAEEIVWAYGGRVAKKFAVTDASQQIYMITMDNNIES